MIHKYNRAGFNIVLDTGSGAVHVVDEIIYDLLDIVTEENCREKAAPDFSDDLLKKYSQEALSQAFNELLKLYDAEMLYSDDSYEEFKNATGLAPVKALCLNVAHDCNLRCRYCFASTGSFCGVRKLMTVDTGKKAIDMLIQLSQNRHNLEVDFFGGEPLMNFDTVKEIVKYARSLEEKHHKNFRFTITTNGLLLDADKAEYINREMANVVLSLDGRKDVNDKLRVRVNGDGCYDTIVPNYQNLIKNRGTKEYYVRGTYTKYNLDFDADVLHLYDLGFDQISVEPVVGPEDDDYAISEKHLSEIEASYTRLMETMVARRKAEKGDFNFFHFMIDLDQGPCAIKRLRGCGSGNEYVAITPDGEIYPCHQFVGNEDFIMGTVDEGITRLDLKEKFAAANIYNKPKCDNCWAKFYCSGGCNANNYNFNKNVLEPHELSCELMRLRLECAIALKAATL
ncbi:MAG: thioether cross-link-forming SCIFF peptide maturase [Oscillospiraceae bacterium]|nr:thioether cross-link-forming SCIFF peptide maturase [Oscillospiraceae bacterium]